MSGEAAGSRRIWVEVDRTDGRAASILGLYRDPAPGYVAVAYDRNDAPSAKPIEGLTHPERVRIAAEALWRPGELPCLPIHNQTQAERAARLMLAALDAAERDEPSRGPHEA